MIMKPKVSVIVPVYNCEKYIERCVKSLQNQTLKEIEIILVNDGSTDKSLDLCCSFQGKDDNIVVITQKNCGASKARKAGLEVAQGEYIGFIDSDDWVDEEMFQCLYGIAQQENADIVQCSFIKTSDSADQSIHHCKKFFWNTEKGNSALSELLCVEKQCRFNYLLWNKIYRRELFSRFEYPTEIKIINDVPVIPRLFYYANNIAYTEQPFVYYYERKDENNKSIMDSLEQSRSVMVLSHVEAFNNVAEFFRTIDAEVYKKSLYLLTMWVCSGIIIKKNEEQRILIRDTVIRHQLYKCEYANVKKKIICLIAYFWFQISGGMM